MSVEIHTDEQHADSPVLQAVFGEALPKIDLCHKRLQAANSRPWPIWAVAWDSQGW